MHIQPITVESFELRDVPSLDPIRVYLQDFGGSGRITVECYGSAYATRFGSIGSASLRNFLISCHPEYLANAMLSSHHRQILKRWERSHFDYLLRIIEAVQRALKEPRHD